MDEFFEHEPVKHGECKTFREGLGQSVRAVRWGVGSILVVGVVLLVPLLLSLGAQQAATAERRAMERQLTRIEGDIRDIRSVVVVGKVDAAP